MKITITWHFVFEVAMLLVLAYVADINFLTIKGLVAYAAVVAFGLSGYHAGHADGKGTLK